jgi:hypothetical protein
MKNKIANNKILILLLLTVIILLPSCEKVVSIYLNQSNPHMVIEGIIKDQSGPYTVVLSKTGNYFEPSLSFPSVSGATIIISDNLGQSDTLKETALKGTYQTDEIVGQSGTTYYLNVKAEGNDYSAITTMPQKIALDTLYAYPRREFDGDFGYDIYVKFKDPPEPGNYYRLNVKASYLLPSDSIDGRRYRLYSDKLTNGNEMTERVRAGRNVKAGDTVSIELLAIDKATYDYFNTLSNILTSDRAASSLSPANPNTNLTGGALGYFAAYTVDKRSIVLK